MQINKNMTRGFFHWVSGGNKPQFSAGISGELGCLHARAAGGPTCSRSRRGGPGAGVAFFLPAPLPEESVAVAVYSLDHIREVTGMWNYAIFLFLLRLLCFPCCNSFDTWAWAPENWSNPMSTWKNIYSGFTTQLLCFRSSSNNVELPLPFYSP